MQQYFRKTALSFATTVAMIAFFSATSGMAAGTPEKDKATKELFQAVHANDLAAAQMSVGNGADVEARDRWGMKAVDVAIDRGNYRIAHFLVSVRNALRAQEAQSAASAKPTIASSSAAAGKPLAPQPARLRAPAAVLDSQPLAAGTLSASAAVLKPAPSNPFDPAVPAFGSQLHTSGNSSASR